MVSICQLWVCDVKFFACLWLFFAENCWAELQCRFYVFVDCWGNTVLCLNLNLFSVTGVFFLNFCCFIFFFGFFLCFITKVLEVFWSLELVVVVYCVRCFLDYSFLFLGSSIRRFLQNWPSLKILFLFRVRRSTI